jgi:hypothetical protein
MRKRKSYHYSLKSYVVKHLRQWHRQLGIATAFALIYLLITGVSINHTSTFKLDQIHITNDFLLSHYQIKPPVDVRYNKQSGLLVTDYLVWKNNHLLIELPSTIKAIMPFEQQIIISTDHQLYLFTQTGEQVDMLDASAGVPEQIDTLCIKQNKLVLITHNGNYETDQNLFEWHKIADVNLSGKCAVFSSSTELSNEQLAQSITNYRSHFLTLDRVIYDLHSGRFFGEIGVYVIDFFAFLIALLSFSGIYIWFRYSRSKR